MARGLDDLDKAISLRDVLLSSRATFQVLPGFRENDPESQNRVYAGLDCDEVYENIFIGDESTAKNKKYLKRIGITHVVNAAQGQIIGQVNTSAEFYSDIGIKYKGITLSDFSVSDASEYFKEVADFMDDAIGSNGKVFVHCMMGKSRSAVFVLAYLMLKRGHTASEAISIVRQRRNIHPNEGFLYQLAVLDNKLRRKYLIFD
ncbi:dual specificity protein phosphatase 3-like [Cimex lectularius]|uniref:Dual specificity protein phosphatase n=1 Tax=Cimex lectularius TaxID=79782 RepID=A0A8I6RS90_CIMLE|nr:dual specificity protein phosphatase 3-like [Cimex lectularius]